MKISDLLAASRYIRRSREGSADRRTFNVESFDGTRLACSIKEGAHDMLVIVAHPAVVDSRQQQVVALAQELSETFTVLKFDFRGHGRSAGKCPAGFQSASKDLEAVARHARSMGFERVGAAGFSLGAAACLLAAARDPDLLDAVVSIGCPPRFPTEMIPGSFPHLSALALRLLGMRVTLDPDPGPDPLDVVSSLGGLPKLVYFGQWETSPAEAVEEFSEALATPKKVETVEGAWHADLAGREREVRHWLDLHLGICSRTTLGGQAR